MRGRNRKKRIMQAYIARACCVLLIIVMFVLMGCGCLYIYEHLFQKDKEDTKTEASTDKDADTDTDTDVQPTGANIPDADAFQIDASGLKIVLDAGHGGNDGGTEGVNALEKEINLSVVLKMKTLLEDGGAEIILTRDEDEWCDLSERNYIANQTGADLFVSIHCNAFEDDASIAGLECYYHKNSDISKGYAETIVQGIEQTGDINTRYAMEQNYQVLRDSSIPAVLIEMGYLSNPTDCQNLISDDYQDLMAETLVQSIVDTLKNTTS